MTINPTRPGRTEPRPCDYSPLIAARLPRRTQMSTRTAIVTGASRGIGKQIAIELGRLGYNVSIVARTVRPHAKLAGSIGETAEAVEAAGGTAFAIAADLSRPEDITAVVG